MNTPETTVPSEPAVASSDGLCVGDEITWTHCLHRGRSIGMTTRTAKIFQLTDKLAFVKFRGEVLNLRRENVRKKGQTTELTEYVMGMGETHNDGTQRPGSPDVSLATETRKPGSLK